MCIKSGYLFSLGDRGVANSSIWRNHWMIMMLHIPQMSCGTQGGSTYCLVATFELSETQQYNAYFKSLIND
jgi:hypothetical protein